MPNGPQEYPDKPHITDETASKCDILVIRILTGLLVVSAKQYNDISTSIDMLKNEGLEYDNLQLQLAQIEKRIVNGRHHIKQAIDALYD